MQQAKHGGGVCEAPVTEGAGELPESAPPPQFSDASAPQLPTSAGQPASVQGLLAEMEDTFDDNALLERKLDDKDPKFQRWLKGEVEEWLEGPDVDPLATFKSF